MELFKLHGTIDVDNSKANKSLDETSQKGQQTESKMSTFFSKIGKGAAVVGKAVMTGMATAGAGVVALTKQSIESYAEYEQLVGGIETLFSGTKQSYWEFYDALKAEGKSLDEINKKWADVQRGQTTVLENAANAYKTSGMSANEYMSTVTSFSASLLQSLGGDTKKAADYADMAIVDMSDNANKMGSSMEMIQNAYQGFAKQNYTMLDNLKLGYGGTKEEMQRLLEDAEKISGQKFDLSSYADVVEAIHTVQTEMGITGTTAKEAASTIQGSLSMTKASWQNLITGMADEEADFDGLIGNFVDSVGTFADNIVPRISVALNGVVDLVSSLGNKLLPKIPGILQELLPSIISGAQGLLSSVIEILPSLISMLTDTALPALISGLEQVINALISALPSVIQALVSALPTLIPQLINGIVSIILTICTALPQVIQPIIDNIPLIFESIVTALLSNLDVLIQGLVGLVVAIIPMLPQIINMLLDETVFFIEKSIPMLIDLLPTILSALGQLIVGICQALPSILGALGRTLIAPFEHTFVTISTLFKELPPRLAEWFAPVTEWFSNAWSKFTEIVSNVWDAIKNVISTGFKLIGSIISAAFQIITLPYRFIWENCKEYVFAAFEWIKSKIQIAIDFIKNIVQIGFNWVKEHIIQPITDAKNKVTEVFNNIRSAIQEKITTAKNKVSEVFDGIKSKITGTVDGIKSSVTTKFNQVKDAMEKPIQKARDTIKGIVDKIKGFFSGMKLQFPNIKLPHFGITPSGWKIGDLLEGSIPKLSIKWYAEAMNKPMIMNKPTVFGYDAGTGKLLGGGEAGSEVVSGTSTLMRMIQAAVSSQNGAVVYYLQKIIEILADYFPQFLDEMGNVPVWDTDDAAVRLAPAMNKQLGIIRMKEERGR